MHDWGQNGYRRAFAIKQPLLSAYQAPQMRAAKAAEHALSLAPEFGDGISIRKNRLWRVQWREKESIFVETLRTLWSSSCLGKSNRPSPNKRQHPENRDIVVGSPNHALQFNKLTAVEKAKKKHAYGVSVEDGV